MMMPANYSAIAENEMTYVVGGASFIEAVGSVTAPIWNVDNVKTFSTNVVTLIGNKFMGDLINNTLGFVFSGHATKKGLGAQLGKVVGADAWKSKNYGDGIATVLGNVAAIYNLGRADVANAAGSAKISNFDAAKDWNKAYRYNSSTGIVESWS